LSFFDEGEQTRRPPRQPRRRSGPTTHAADDQQTLLIRRAVAAGIALLIVILLVVGIRSCVSSQRNSSLRNYNRSVGALIQESDDQVGKKFFSDLASGSASAGTSTSGSATVNIDQDINQTRVNAEDLVRRAKRQSVPGDMTKAQRYLVLVLGLRRDAITEIADKLRSARAATGADQAVTQIAGQMQAFLSSDVVYSQRVVPYIKKALDGAGIQGQTVATTQFLPDLGWLAPDQVAKRLGAPVNGAAKGPVAPGSHGHQLETVSVGGTDLKENGANKVSKSSPVFSVKFVNQGENNESNVLVKVSIEGSGQPITLTKPVPSSPAGQESTAEVPLGQAPPTGAPVTVTVEVQKVPGEAQVDNNKKSYQVLFGS
jgi:hypothetical protein